MEENKFKKGADFFGELARRFQREQIEFSAPENNRLPILLNGQEIGAVIPDGSMRIRKEFIDDTEVSDLCQRTGEIAAEVREYMKLLEDDPSLKRPAFPNPISCWQTLTAMSSAGWKAAAASSSPHGNGHTTMTD